MKNSQYFVAKMMKKTVAKEDGMCYLVYKPIKLLEGRTCEPRTDMHFPDDLYAISTGTHVWLFLFRDNSSDRSVHWLR